MIAMYFHFIANAENVTDIPLLTTIGNLDALKSVVLSGLCLTLNTIGVDFKIRTIELEGKTVKLQIVSVLSSDALFGSRLYHTSSTLLDMTLHNAHSELISGTLLDKNDLGVHCRSITFVSLLKQFLTGRSPGVITAVHQGAS